VVNQTNADATVAAEYYATLREKKVPPGEAASITIGYMNSIVTMRMVLLNSPTPERK
jgi:hypothetical protein